jgi:hypothetical protein
VHTKEDIVKNWLPRYTGLSLEEFRPHILLTNFDNYLDIFCQQTGAVIKVKDKAMKVAVAEDMVMINFGMGSPNGGHHHGPAERDRPQSGAVPGQVRRFEEEERVR